MYAGDAVSRGPITVASVSTIAPDVRSIHPFVADLRDHRAIEGFLRADESRCDDGGENDNETTEHGWLGARIGMLAQRGPRRKAVGSRPW